MPEATPTNTPSRRGFLGSVAKVSAAAGLAVAGVSVPAEAADADVVELWTKYTAARTWREESDKVRFAAGTPQNAAIEAACDANECLIDDLLEDAIETEAVTLRGVRAKAEIVAAELDYGLDNFDMNSDSPEMRLVMSLLDDLRELAA